MARYTAARLAVITLGRARPGFDQVWAATVRHQCHEHLLRHYTIHVEEEIAKRSSELRAMLLREEVINADVIIFLQPSIADGTLATTIAQYASDCSLLFWATTEKPQSEIVSSNSLVGTHLFVATLVQYGLNPAYVYGEPQDTRLHEDLGNEIAMLSARTRARRARIGLIGSYAPGFIDLHVDPRHFSQAHGATLEHISMSEFFNYFNAVSTPQIDEYYEKLLVYDIPTRDLPHGEQLKPILQLQARYWAAYETIIAEREWSALALRCWPDLPQQTEQWPYLAVSIMLHEGVAVAIEGDADAAFATEIARYLAPGGVYLSDWLAHDDESVVLWHGGAIDPALCVDDSDSRYRAHIAPHFNNTLPAVIEGNIQEEMDVTIWRVWQQGGSYYSGCVEGRSAIPTQHFRGTTAHIACHSESPDAWLKRQIACGMPHHVLMVRGHLAAKLRRFAYYMRWKWIE